jgi:predicted HTH transcriptional regulator
MVFHKPDCLFWPVSQTTFGLMTKLTLPPVRPDPETLLSAALATGGESSRFDFEKELDLSSEERKVRLVKAAGAFANTDEGGFIFVRISNKREIVGLNEKLAAKFDQTDVQIMLRSFLAPSPAIQFRHYEHQKKQIVIIEVEPFAEIPCIVKQGATQGSGRLFAGTFLHRNDAAQSTVLTAEKDICALCDET